MGLRLVAQMKNPVFSTLRSRRSQSLLWLRVLLPIALVCVTASAACAQTNNPIDQILDTYKSKTANFEGVLQGYAFQLFWLLAGIEFVWSNIRLALEGGDFSDFIEALFYRIMYLGFPLTLLKFSAPWVKAIIESFQQAASAASIAAGGTGAITPSSVLFSGVAIAQQIWNTMSVYKVGDSFVLALAGIIVLLSFGLITALLAMVIVRSFFAIYVSPFFNGFGGSQWTSQIAFNTFRHAISAGAKLFMAELVIGVGEGMVNDWVTQAQSTNLSLEAAATIAGASIVLLALTKGIPDMAHEIINGTSLASGAELHSVLRDAVESMAAATLAITSASTLLAKTATDRGDGSSEKNPTSASESARNRRSHFGPGPSQNTSNTEPETVDWQIQAIRNGDYGAGYRREQDAHRKKMDTLSESSAGSATTGSSNKVYPDKNS